MGIPLVAGRVFAETDGAGSPAVGVISQAFARQSFGELDPVGRRLLVNYAGEFRPVEIVGVAGDVKHASLEAPAEPHLYVPYYQTHPKLLVWLALNQYLLVRGSGDVLALSPAVGSGRGGGRHRPGPSRCGPRGSRAGSPDSEAGA